MYTMQESEDEIGARDELACFREILGSVPSCMSSGQGSSGRPELGGKCIL